MKAYIYKGKDDLAIAEAPTPSCEPGGAVVRVLSASICGTDVRAYRFGNAKITPPRIVGHELCGEIVEIDEAVEGVAQGDRVLVAPAIGCGRCRPCRAGRTNMCDDLKTLGFDYEGAFAEFMAIPPQAFAMGNVIGVPDGVPVDTVPLAEPLACCINGQSYLDIGPGDTVLIFGAGFIGCMHAELARRAGARDVFMAEPARDRLGRAAELVDGLTPIDPNETDLHERIMDVTGGRGIDVAITACPAGQAQKAAQALAAKCGRLSLFGGLPGDSAGWIDSNIIHYKELSVFGAHASTPDQNRQALETIARGELNVEPYIGGTVPLERIEDAFAALAGEGAFKMIVNP